MFKHLKQMGCGVGGLCFVFFPFFLDVSISLSVCGRTTLEFFLFKTLSFFYVTALCKMTLNKVCLSDSRDNLP